MDEKKYKRSKQRTRILEILIKTDTHPTADWIYSRLKQEFPHLSIGTVYRNLTILQKQGLVKRIENGSTFDRFDSHIKPHYHFICEECGEIRDLDVEIDDTINKIVTSLTPYTIKKHEIDFYGICHQCKSRKN